MPRTGRVCVHEKRAEIDQAIREGTWDANVARQLGISRETLSGHQNHLPPDLMEAPERSEEIRTDPLGEQMRDWMHRAQHVLETVQGQGVHRLVGDPQEASTNTKPLGGPAVGIGGTETRTRVGEQGTLVRQ